MLGEVGACITALDKLKREIRKPEEFGKEKQSSALAQGEPVSPVCPKPPSGAQNPPSGAWLTEDDAIHRPGAEKPTRVEWTTDADRNSNEAGFTKAPLLFVG